MDRAVGDLPSALTPESTRRVDAPVPFLVALSSRHPPLPRGPERPPHLPFQMLADLNTYLNKAIPDTRLTIKKYLDVKFEYLVSGPRPPGGAVVWARPAGVRAHLEVCSSSVGRLTASGSGPGPW